MKTNYIIILCLICLTMYVFHFKEIYAMISNTGVDLDSFALLILGVIIGSLAFACTYFLFKIIFRTKMFSTKQKQWIFVLFGYIVALFFWSLAIYLLTPIMNIT